MTSVIDNWNNEDSWDDSVLIEMFNSAVHSHHTAGQPAPQPKAGKNNKKRTHFEHEAGTTTSSSEGSSSSSSSSDRHHSKFAPGEREGIPGAWQSVSQASAPFIPSTTFQHASPNDLYHQGLGHSGLQQAAQQIDAAQVDSAYHEMLTAWFNCGAATGRYQTLLEIQRGNATN